MITKGLYTSNSQEWATPQDLFDRLNHFFHFTLDVCATEQNAKCEKYYTVEENVLLQDWTGERCWMNPPYGREIGKWVKKAAESHALVVGLLPARVDTVWWHRYVQGKASVRFLRGRLKFGGSKNSAPFPSAIAVWWWPL